jgi:penicillin-binding protein 1A
MSRVPFGRSKALGGENPLGKGGEESNRRTRRGWRLAAGIIGGALLLLLVIAGAALAWLARDLPFDSFAAGPEERPAVILEAADGSLIGRRGDLRAEPISRDELPDHLVEAVLAIEDRRFYDHGGLDALGIMRAAWRNYRAGGVVEGGSTITQQLAKVLFLESDRTIRRKLQEAVIALWLEARLSKDEILTRYLDNVYFGAGTVGIGAAALAYFDKPVSEISLAESAMLAGLIRAPSRLNPLHNLKDAQERAATVLRAMVETGFISREEALEAALAPAVPSPGASGAAGGSWFADWVYGEALDLAGPLLGSVRVRTTLRPELQALAEKAVAEGLTAAGPDKKAGEAALVAMTRDGAVVAMVGGRDYSRSQFNRAAQAERQPGSAFKLFVYLAALRNGWSLDDPILDGPIEVEGWKPQNYSGRYRGKVPLEQAFALSLNTPTVRLAQDVGIDAIAAAARDLGIDAELERNLGLSLGTSGVSLLDLTGAFAAVAAGRMPVQPWGITGLAPTSGEDDRLVMSPRQETRPLDHREELLRLLEGVVRNGTGRRAALDGFAAGKTGTSQNYRDAWFIGFTDHLIAGVWVGNDDDSPMQGVTGGSLPAEIWQAFMAQATGLAPVEVAPESEEGPAVEISGAENPADADPAAAEQAEVSEPARTADVPLPIIPAGPPRAAAPPTAPAAAPPSSPVAVAPPASPAAAAPQRPNTVDSTPQRATAKPGPSRGAKASGNERGRGKNKNKDKSKGKNRGRGGGKGKKR